MYNQIDQLLSDINSMLDVQKEQVSLPININNTNILKFKSNDNENVPHQKWSNLDITIDNDLYCTDCKIKREQISSSIFWTQWTECNHAYCSKCMSRIINEYLSLLNEVPTCLYPECHQRLNIKSHHHRNMFNSLYPEKYQITITFKEYDTMHKLINGYIRRINVISNDIILLIADYYHFHFVKPIQCNSNPSIMLNLSSSPPFLEHITLSQAVKLQVNDKIDHRDKFGRFTPATIVEKHATNFKIHYDGWSPFWDEWSDCIEELYRFATYNSISTRPSHRFLKLKKGGYIDINPRRRHYGWKYGEIKKMDKKSGQIQVGYKCDDIEYIYWTHSDNESEIAPFSTKCGEYGHFNCNQCNGEPYVLALDFNKLGNNQKICMQCNEYHPITQIRYWSKCNHVVCIECLLSSTKHDIIGHHKIPICPDRNCQQEINENDVAFLYGLWQRMDTYKHYNLENKLKAFLFRKNRFKCSYCSEWHENNELYRDKTTNCNHQYSNECNNYWMFKCGHSDCIKCEFKCEICQDFHLNKYLSKWTKCGHKYGGHCAKKYINEWISQQPSIWNNMLPHNEELIPLCIHKECNELLDVLCAHRIGATSYQCQQLDDLRQQSILVRGRSPLSYHDTNKLHSKSINKNTLMDEDFASIKPIDIH